MKRIRLRCCLEFAPRISPFLTRETAAMPDCRSQALAGVRFDNSEFPPDPSVAQLHPTYCRVDETCSRPQCPYQTLSPHHEAVSMRGQCLLLREPLTIALRPVR